MMELKAEAREAGEDNVKLRKSGFVPAVFYGPKEKSTPIKISAPEFDKIYDTAGESSIIILKEGKNEHETLIHDVQFDAITGRPIHADFYVIEKGKKIEVAIPLKFFGEAPAEKTLGGSLVKVIHELEISAMPKDLPAEIEVDISTLVDFDAQVRAGDLKLPEGVELRIPADEVIALVQEPKEEEPEPTEIDLESIEVEAKGKKPEEGDAGAEGDSAGSAPKDDNKSE